MIEINPEDWLRIIVILEMSKTAWAIRPGIFLD
jgi:hypothetical protein